MGLSARVAEFIDRNALLAPGQGVVVGVSGGPDSLCLLDCLHLLGYRPVVAHFDHHLRENSAEDADFVRKIAASYNLPFELGEGRSIGGEHSIEETARIQRYRFLADTATKHAVDRIAVGHTANDQAETVLMHLIRGAGSTGLRGMLPAVDIWQMAESTTDHRIQLIRPLLEIWRRDTEAYCVDLGQETLADPSNQDLSYFRNRLRHQLIPELGTYNPRVQEVLVKTAKVMAADVEAIDQLVEANWADWVSSSGDGVLVLQTAALLEAPLAAQRATLRRAIAQLDPQMRDIGFDAIERALRSIQAGKRMTLPGKMDLLTLNGEAFLRAPGATISHSDLPQVASPQIRWLKVPFEFDLASDWSMTGAEIKHGGELPVGLDEVWFDASELEGDLAIRAPQTGDRIAPLGMSGSIKLSDLFVNRKVPRLARERWPVVTSGDRIIWVAGLHRSEHAKVVRETQRIIQLRLVRPDPAEPSS